MIAGFCHGASHLAWKTVTKWREPFSHTLRIPGVMISHGMSHSILFGSYEVFKDVSLWALDAHQLNYTGKKPACDAE